jgi:hypothetical protein
LWNVCKEHPEVYCPDYPDNVNFFTVHYHRGLDWYERTYFEAAGDERAVGEFSNSYLVFPPALERIARDLPEVKLTMTFRNPVERAFLNWAHIHLKNKPYGLNARAGIQVPLQRTLEVHGHQWFRQWMWPGCYAAHLERIYRLFPAERVLVTFYDDLRTDPEAYVRRYFAFLGVDADFRTTIAHQDINPDAEDADPTRWVPADALAEMHQVFRDDTERLERMLRRDLSEWKEAP